MTDAREHVDALLALSDVELREAGEPEPRPPDLGALGGWRFASAADGIEADVYVFDDADAVGAAAGRLLELAGRADERGLPAVGTNGGLAYVVRSTAPEAAVEAKYAALDVAGALGGEEE